MTSKKKLKKRINKLQDQVAELQNTAIGILWIIINMIQTYDGNATIIQKTFDEIVIKLDELEKITNSLNEDEKEEIENGKG